MRTFYDIKSVNSLCYFGGIEILDESCDIGRVLCEEVSPEKYLFISNHEADVLPLVMTALAFKKREDLAFWLLGN